MEVTDPAISTLPPIYKLLAIEVEVPAVETVNVPVTVPDDACMPPAESIQASGVPAEFCQRLRTAACEAAP